MRKTILDAAGTSPPSHFGHAYERLAPPPKRDGSADDAARNAWLTRCEAIRIDADYRQFYKTWAQSFTPGTCLTEEITTRTRLLIGHGNPSGAEVGLTVHHTWGVPILPGSAQKGLLAHYIDAVYGDDESAGEERRKWRGPTWKDRSVAPEDRAGDYFAALFGAPPVTGDDTVAQRGFVEFHDALFIPDPVKEDRPFVRDVLTVHQRAYYNSSGKDGFPNDWDDPYPVGFITVRPGARFLLALSGPDDWTTLALRLLRDALRDWGAGGKTSAGYGRIK
jgi:CRISPR-associated protein Cmr6